MYPRDTCGGERGGRKEVGVLYVDTVACVLFIVFVCFIYLVSSYQFFFFSCFFPLFLCLFGLGL